MKDSRGYLARMEKSMREKLFFINHIDLDNKIVIDFGAANVAMVRELLDMEFRNTTYFCLENNQEFFEECKKLEKEFGADVYVFSGLSEMEMWLRHNKQYGQETREVVLICSSVLHECTPAMQKSIVGFSRSWCDYMVVRDMFYENHSMDEKEMLDYLEKIISLAPRPDLMQQFFYMRGVDERSIAEYLLKYSYVANWATEVQEKYLSVDWIRIKYFTTNEVDASVVYEDIYTNKFIASQVYNQFGIEMRWPTHCKLILKMNRIEVNDYE